MKVVTKKELVELMKRKGAFVQLTQGTVDQLKRDSEDLISNIENQVIAFNQKEVFNEALGRIEQIEMDVDYDNCIINLSNGQYIRLDGMKVLQCHDARDKTLEVKSKAIIINGCTFEIKDIIVVSANTFTTTNAEKLGIFYEIKF